MSKHKYDECTNDRAVWSNGIRRDKEVPDSELEDWDITVGDGVE